MLNPRTTDRLLTTREVARLFGVCSKTVVRWSRDGILTVFKTPGGHNRYYASEVERRLNNTGP